MTTKRKPRPEAIRCAPPRPVRLTKAEPVPAPIRTADVLPNPWLSGGDSAHQQRGQD